ncbi:MAG: GNAT family N-acetyltransferase [Candidatus Zipacnadales bacterium]
MHWAIVTDRNEADYLWCLECADTPMGQHAPGYVAALACCPAEEPIRIVAYDRGEPVGAAVGMLYSGGPLRIVESLPYGYGGVISGLTGKARQRCMALLCDALVTVARCASARLLTIQTPPFPDGPTPYRQAFRPDFELRSFVQYVELSRDLPWIRTLGNNEPLYFPSRVRRNHRRNIRRALQAGLKVYFRNSEESLKAYCLLQEKRMSEVGGRPRPRKFLEGIHRYMLPEGTGWLLCVQKDRHILSATALLGIRDVVDVFLICMDSAAKAMQPNALLCYYAIHWAADAGFRILNFQSSLRRNDTLYHWKAGWGAIEAPVSIMTRILGDIQPILKLPLEELREAYTYHYVLPYAVLEAVRAGCPLDSPDLKVLEKGT